MNTAADQVLKALRDKVEYCDDGVWGGVYLDNARPKGMNDKIFRAALATAFKQGLYKVDDGFA